MTCRWKAKHLGFTIISHLIHITKHVSRYSQLKSKPFGGVYYYFRGYINMLQDYIQYIPTELGLVG